MGQVYESDNVLLFAGGVGVTFVLPHFVRTALHSPMTACKLVWMVRDLGEFCKLLESASLKQKDHIDACIIIQDELEMLSRQLQSQRQAGDGTDRCAPLLVEIHVTGSHSRIRALSSVDLEARPLLRVSAEHTRATEDEEQKSIYDTADAKTPLLVTSPWIDITVKHGRASKVIEQHFPANELSSAQSLMVMSCGPAALCDEVRMHTKTTSASCMWGSVHYIEECFSW